MTTRLICFLFYGFSLDLTAILDAYEGPLVVTSDTIFHCDAVRTQYSQDNTQLFPLLLLPDMLLPYNNNNTH